MENSLEPWRAAVEPLEEDDFSAWLPDDIPRFCVPGVYFYAPDGTPLPGEIKEQSIVWGEHKMNPDNYRRERFIGPKVTLNVSTAYLGNNEAIPLFRPAEEMLILIYETMIFGMGDAYLVARYGSRPAAWQGHDRVVALLENALPGVPHQTLTLTEDGWPEPKGWLE